MQIVLLHSGGIDSSVALYWLRNQGHQVFSLGLHYGQRHNKELQYAKRLCERLDLNRKEVDISGVKTLLSKSSQTGSHEVPEGHYSSESMKLTIVPNRNMFMLSLAIAWAVNDSLDGVCYAAHAGDHTIYPDCRPAFASAMKEAAKHCDWHSVELLSPFIEKTKHEIVEIGQNLNVPFELTWSCYKGLEYHCGKCGTCVERIEAFEKAGVQDPTEYMS